MNILYVEDDPNDAVFTRRALSSSAPHFNLDIVSTQREALARLGQPTQYELVLTDMRLPDGDGLAILTYIRARVLPLAVVVVTGGGDEDIAVAVMKAGADDYVVKRENYLARLPLILESALHRYLAQTARRTRPLRVLYAEHIASDIDLTRRHLEQYAPHIHLEAVPTSAELLRRLPEQGALKEYEVVLLDYQMPGMNALEMLKEIYQTRGLEVPVVLVTGRGDEEVALEALKLGAADYLTKSAGYLYKLPTVLENVYHRAQLAREQTALRQSEERFSKAFYASPVAISIVTLAEKRFLEVNDNFLELVGQPSREAIIDRTVLELKVGPSPDHYAHLVQVLQEQGRVKDFETRFNTLAGEKRDVLVSLELIELTGLPCILMLAFDITERKQAEEKIKQQLERLTSLNVIDQAISGTFELRIILDILLDQVTTQLHVDAATVLLHNPQRHTLEFAAGRGFRGGGITKLSLRLGEDYAGKAALERRLIGVSDLTQTDQLFSKAHLTAGEGFIAFYVVPLIAKGQIKGVLEVFHRARLNPDEEWLHFLETLAGQAAIAIDNAELFNRLYRSNADLAQAYDATIEGWSRALDLRDKETEGHTQRVTEMTLRLAETMGQSDEELVHIRRGGLLHDIGKLGVPDGILLKPEPLTDDEWVLMKRHPQYAYDMLAPVGYLRRALDIPYCHHEKWDGTGYPRGLKGEQIPLAARLFAVVDVWDALRSDRPYRKGWSEEKVREHIRGQSGSHFDPQVVEAFLKLED